MAFWIPTLSVFQITDTGAGLRDISANILSVSGLPGPRELIDVTAFGDSGHKSIAGLENVVITLEMMWTELATTGSDTIFGPLSRHTAATAWDCGPSGKTTGKIKYSGTCWVRNYEITGRVGAILTARAELQVEGVVTRGTYA